MTSNSNQQIKQAFYNLLYKQSLPVSSKRLLDFKIEQTKSTERFRQSDQEEFHQQHHLESQEGGSQGRGRGWG